MYQPSCGSVTAEQPANPFALRPWGGPMEIVAPTRATVQPSAQAAAAHEPAYDPGYDPGYGGDTPPPDEDYTLIYVGAAAAAVIGGYLLWRSTQ